MFRLIVIILLVFAISFTTLLVVFGVLSLVSIWVISQISSINASPEINADLVLAFLKAATLPGIMMGSIVTGLFSIILYRAIHKKQHIKVAHFVSIFRSFVLFTFFIALAYYLFILTVIYSKSGIFLLLPYLNMLGYFFDYTLPFIWLILAFYWVKKYEDKFLTNDDEFEWTLK